MFRHSVRFSAVCVFVGTLLFCLCTNVGADTGGEIERKKWAVSLYYARLNDGTLGETVTFSAKLEDASFLALALARRFYTFRDMFDLEFEGQVAKHFQEQDHWEFNLLGTFRWIKFPWDRYLDTSLAAGAGLSYATEEPPIEIKNHGKVNQLSGYLMFEAAFSLPQLPRWDAFARIHHRSSAGGLFGNDVKGGSNAYGAGIRFKF
jgi:hypothetical protein